MPRITDKADLNAGTEYAVDIGAKTVQLLVAGNLSVGSANGVITNIVYSELIDYWIATAGLQVVRFPFYIVDGPIGTMLELRDGWEWADATTISLLRSGGFAYTSDAAGATKTAEYICFIQGGALADNADQPYYRLGSDTSPTDFGVADEFNECIQIYGDVSHGNFDKRSNAYLYSREPGKTYGFYDLVTAQELNATTYRSFLVPMTTTTDPDIVASDATIDADAPYTSMSLTWLDGTGFAPWTNATVYAANAVVSSAGRWYITTLGGTSSGTGVADDTGVTDWSAYSGERDVDGTYYAYNIILAGNSGTKTQIRDWLQRQLRKTTDIDAGSGTSRGDITTDATLTFSGSILATSAGLYVDAHLVSEQSDYRFTDVGGTERSITFVPTFTINSVDSNGSAVNFDTGTRIRIVDTTNSTELYNATPGAVNTISVNHTAGGTVAIKYELNAINGSTSRSKHIEGTSSIGTSNVAINVVQESDTVYVDNLVDGSAVTGLSISSGKIDIDANRASDTLTFQELYAWYCYYQNTLAGIRDSNFLITANTQTSYTVDDTFDVKNTKAASHLLITGANVKTVSGSYTDWVDLTGDNITVIPDSVVAFSFGTGALTTLQDQNLAAAAAKPSATEIVDEWEAQSQADPTGFQVNVKEMNDATLAGTGTSGDKWTGV